MALPNSINTASPAGTDSPGLGDDQFRDLKQFLVDVFGFTSGTNVDNKAFNYNTNGVVDMLRRLSLQEGAAIASAAALTPGADGNLFHITGTTGITSIASITGAGPIFLIFDDALTITHNATSLILLGGVNLATAAGMVVCFMHEGSGNYRELFRGIGFDSTVPANLGTAATGSANTAARRDHVHGHGDGGAANVHGLGASVNVLGNRAASGEFVQRANFNPATHGSADNPVYDATSTAVTFAVAFSSTPFVMHAGTTEGGTVVGGAHNITTTGYNHKGLTFDSGSDPDDRRYVALGA